MEQNDKEDTFLARWLNNDLKEKEREAFEKTKEFKEYSKIIEKLEQFQAPNFEKEELFKRIQAKVNPKGKVRSLMPKWFVAVAASVAILLSVYYSSNTDTQYATSFGEQLAVVLPDGSKVLLNAKSELTLNPEGWKKGKRNLTLYGEAYFKVSKGSTFTVNTELGTVSVLGTKFNIKTTQDFFDVKCFEGKVSVKSKKENTILTPGQGFCSLGDNLGEERKFQITSPGWLLGESTFERTPLKYVIQELESQYEAHINSDKVNLNQLFSGSFTNKNKEIALQSVFIPLHIAYTIGASGKITLSEK